jgi:hypothetical protein
MIPWGLLGSGFKAGLEVYKNKKAADVAMSEAKLLHIEKMKRGEIEFSGKIADNQKNDWKDEFVLLTISSPLFCWHILYLQKMKRCNKRWICIFKNYKICLGGLLAYGFPWWLPFTDLRLQT